MSPTLSISVVPVCSNLTKLNSSVSHLDKQCGPNGSQPDKYGGLVCPILTNNMVPVCNNLTKIWPGSDSDKQCSPCFTLLEDIC